VSFGKTDLLDYMRGHRLAVIGSIAADGAPQAALVGIAVTPRHEIIFDTVSDSRKHSNLERDSRASVTFTGPHEKTLQLEGAARLLASRGDVDAELREIYYHAWPDGRDRVSWPKIAYWCIRPIWGRYSDFEAGPLIETFDWPVS
jgi:general stress protein 26